MIPLSRLIYPAALLSAAAICVVGFTPPNMILPATKTTTTSKIYSTTEEEETSSSMSAKEDFSYDISGYESKEELFNADDIYVSTEKIAVHHSAIKTRNIITAIKFYGLLGFKLERKYLLPDGARAAWMSHNNNNSTGQRLEFIEIPSSKLDETPNSRIKAMDLLDKYPYLLGYNHVALDVTQSLKDKNMTSLCEWMDDLNRTSVQTYGKHLKPPALECQHVMITPALYDLAMIYDPDGCLVELLNYRKVLNPNMLPDW